MRSNGAPRLDAARRVGASTTWHMDTLLQNCCTAYEGLGVLFLCFRCAYLFVVKSSKVMMSMGQGNKRSDSHQANPASTKVGAGRNQRHFDLPKRRNRIVLS